MHALSHGRYCIGSSNEARTSEGRMNLSFSLSGISYIQRIDTMPLEWRWSNAKQAGRDPRFICHMLRSLMCNVHSRRRELAQRLQPSEKFPTAPWFDCDHFYLGFVCSRKWKTKLQVNAILVNLFLAVFFFFTRIKWTGSDVEMVTIARMPCYFNAIRFEQKMHWHFIVSSIKYRRRIILTLVRSLACSVRSVTVASHQWNAFLLFRAYNLLSPIIFIVSPAAMEWLRCEYSHSLFCRVHAFRATVSFLFAFFVFFLRQFGILSSTFRSRCTTMRIDCGFYFLCVEKYVFTQKM